MSPKSYATTTLVLAIFWQIWIVTQILISVPQFESTLADFGGEIPGITQAFLSTNPYFPVLPVLSIVSVALALRRDPLDFGLLIVVFFVVFVGAAGVSAFSGAAMEAPISAMRASFG